MAAGAYSATATIAACMSSRLANGRFSHACSATHGEFSKMPPNFSTKAARSMALIGVMSAGPAIPAAISSGPSIRAQINDDKFLRPVIISAPLARTGEALAAAIGRVAPGRCQQRNVIVRRSIGHAELDHGFL